MSKEKCKNCGEVIKSNEVSRMCKQADDLKAALEAIDNMSACGPFAPDPRDLVRAMGERAQKALKK